MELKRLVATITTAIDFIIIWRSLRSKTISNMKNYRITQNDSNSVTENEKCNAMQKNGSVSLLLLSLRYLAQLSKKFSSCSIVVCVCVAHTLAITQTRTFVPKTFLIESSNAFIVAKRRKKWDKERTRVWEEQKREVENGRGREVKGREKKRTNKSRNTTNMPHKVWHFQK